MNEQEWRHLFVGRNDELERLRATWGKVCRTDGRPAEPQMVVLLAESGLGKTRLAQEFYRWLSTTQEAESNSAPEGYWPDAFVRDNESLDVNPRFPEGTGKRERIPWLWWGIRFERPIDRNQIGSRCGLQNYLHALVTHTQPLVITRELKKKQKSVFWSALTKIAELTPVAPLITIFNAGKEAKELKDAASESRKLRSELSMSPAETEQRELVQLEDLVFDYLSTVLDSQNTDAETVPVVVFLDDAQWADPVTLRFVQRLMAAAIEHRWPLLVVATHWEVEWKQFQHEPVAVANRPDRLSNVTESLRLASSSLEPWLDIYTLPLVSDLSDIVRMALPGLIDEQLRVVLNRAGGNPLLLEEILLFLQRRPEFFIARQFHQALTEHGFNEVCDRRFKLHELVDDRFYSLNEEVKRALGWSSEQGLTFLIEIVLASGKCVDATMTENRIRSALREADWPHSLIQTLGDPGTFNRSEFRQAAFHLVAKQFLHFQPDELSFVRQAIRDTLTAWLLTGHVDQLPKEEQLDALLMARRTLSPADDEPEDVRKAWCRGMAQLAQLYRQEFLWDQAWEIAEAWAHAAPSGWPLDWLDFWQQVTLCRILRSAAKYRLSAQIMRPLVESITEYAGQAADQKTLRDLSSALDELGDSERAEGHRVEALSAYRRGLEISERIVTYFGETHESLRDLSISLGRVGDVERAEGRREEALSAYRRGLEIRERIVTQFGETHESLRDLSVSLDGVGDVERAEGRREEALSAYRRGLEIRERIVTQFGETHESLRDLSISLGRVGDVERAEGRREEALSAYRRGLEISNRIVTQFGETPQNLRDVSVDLDRVGDVDLAESRDEEALSTFRLGLEIRERIVTQFGETPESLRDVSISLDRVGDMERIKGCREEARSAYRRGLEISERIITDFGETPESLSDVIVSRLKISRVDIERAREHLFHARDIVEALIARNWATAEQRSWKEGIETALKELGDDPSS